MEIELMTKDNIKINCIFLLPLETDPDGTIYIQGIIHDITNLKESGKSNVAGREAGRSR